MKKIFLFVFTFLLICQYTFAQTVPAELKRKIAGKKNLNAIMKEVEAYYKKENEEKERRSKHKPTNLQTHKPTNEDEEFENGLQLWKRWEYFNQSRLKPNGDLEDIEAKTIKAWEKVKAKYEGLNQPQSGTDAVWNFLGPTTMNYQGGFYRGLSRCDRVVFHPTDPNTIYVCTNNGGLWRSTNGGTNWDDITFNFPIHSAAGVAINPTNTSNIYVLTGDAKWGNGVGQNSCGLWVTYDGGNNWFRTSFVADSVTNGQAGYKLMMMPGTPATLFAATASGLYRSTNSGSTWTQPIGGAVYDIEFDPSQPNTVYASANGVFFRSTDGGATWPLNQRTNIAGATRIEIGVSPANSNYVYLLCGPYIGGVGTSNFNGVYRSTTKGSQNSFVLRSNSPNILCDATTGIVASSDAGDQSGYDLAIDVHKTNAEVITVGGKILWTSSNGGTTLTNLTLYNEGSAVATPPANYIHPDIQDIAYNPLNNNLYACSDGGIFLSTNGGTVWTSITNALHTSTFFHMGSAAFDVNRIAGGTQDNGIKFKYSAGDFNHIAGGDGFDCSFGPSISSHLYATGNSSVVKFDLNGLAVAVTTPANTSFFPTIAADPVTINTVYLAAGAAGVMKTTNGGSSWTQVLSNNMKTSICTCPNNASRVYVTSGSTIYRTDNGGTSWSIDLTLKPGFPVTSQITDINVCSTNSSFVYVTIGGYTANKVFYSNDAGNNWSNLSGTLPAEVKVNCVVVDNANNSYIGTDMGVYYCSVTGSDWTPYYNFLPRAPVMDLSINQASSRINAATYGHGIWYNTLYTACDVDYTLSGAIDGEKFYQVSNRITTTSSVIGGNSTNVIARAGNEVLLSPGFTVPEGNNFRAYNGACESGPVPILRALDQPPAFMSQVDRGDSTTAYRYGFITVDPSSLDISLTAVVAGDFSIIVTDKDESQQFVRINAAIDSPGTIIKSFDRSLLPDGKYYVQLYYNGRLVHVQELLMKL